MIPFALPAPQVIASCGTTDLVEDGALLRFVERGGDSYAIALFVLGLLGFVAGGNAVALALQGAFAAAAVIGLLFGVIVVGFVITRRAQQANAGRPVHALPVVLVLDRARGLACEADGRPLASLHDLVFRRQMQLASSSSALAARWSGGERVVARASPFTGSVDGLYEALQARGIRVD